MLLITYKYCIYSFGSFFFFVNLIGSASGVAVDGENKVSFSNFMFKG